MLTKGTHILHMFVVYAYLLLPNIARIYGFLKIIEWGFDLLQFFVTHVCVYLGGSRAAVSKQFLYEPQVGTIFQQVGSVAVSQLVEGYGVLDVRFLEAYPEDFCKALGVELLAGGLPFEEQGEGFELLVVFT